MSDIFDNTILCKDCQRPMERALINRNGFSLRAVVCNPCDQKILHPKDEHDYNRFINLKKKEYRVKMRLVGNSYAISIPKEVVSFLQNQEQIMSDVDDMVRLCFEDLHRLSIHFGGEQKIE